jgi:formylglycine-generating enzyme
MTTCPAGTGSESCCTSLEVAGGTYYRTYTYGSPSSYADPATVSGFRLDKYLVTVGRFRQFVAAWNNGSGYWPSAGSGKHRHLNCGNGLNATGGGYEAGWDATDWNNTTYIDPTNANLACGSSYDTWTNTAGSQENLPINCVDWYEAYAFCIWDGGFLPSETESEYAAAGGNQQRDYPWGLTVPGTACPGTGCEYAIYGCDYPSGSGSCTGVANIAPVGTASLGIGAWGQLDLIGEIFEWNLDDWDGPYVDPCTDCADLSPTPSGRDIRGGFYGTSISVLHPSDQMNNGGEIPASREYAIGFRCARTP